MPDEGKPALFQLTAGSLKHLDRGAAGVSLDHAIARAVKDCIDRPGDDRARKITLQIEIKPVTETINNVITCEGAKGVYKVRLRTPDWESNELDFGVRENGMLIFSEDSPANHRQAQLFTDEEGDE